ncbi:MAG: SDR family oxidoreductase [Acidobacteria bacterium]|nr:SDR family oxidoreductase [Acidobacteriota bacterium]
MSVARRAALVAGAASIGRAVARTLAGAGARLAIVDADHDRVHRVVSEIADAGAEAVALVADVGLPGEADRTVAETVERLGGLDILVTTFDVGRDEEFLAMNLEQWSTAIAGNLTPLFLICQAAARHMAERGYGRIVNVSARDWLGWDRRANYAAAKAGVVGLTRSIAWELVSRGITANIVAPGWIDDERARSLPEVVRSELAMQPIPKLGSPEDVAHAVLFMAADEAGYMTGQTLYVDGGRSVFSSLTA